MTVEELKQIHSHSINNKAELEVSHDIWCFYCKKQVKYAEIVDWIDRNIPQTIYKSDQPTALCPYCGIDSLIGGPPGRKIKPEVIDEMHEYWFGIKRK